MNLSTFLPTLRHVFQYGAGFLTSKGVIDGSLEETVVGIGVGVVTLVWWFVTKQKPEATTPVA